MRKQHCAQCGKSWRGRQRTCPWCDSDRIYEVGGGWEKPVLIGVAAAVVIIAVALFATRQDYYWDDTTLSVRMTSAVRQGPSEEYQGESLWQVDMEVSNQGQFDAWVSMDYFSFYDEEDWWLSAEPDYPVYLADEDRQAWHEVWLPAGQSTVITGLVSVPDGSEELILEYSPHSYSGGRERTTFSLPAE